MTPIAQTILLEITIQRLQAQNAELMRIISTINESMSRIELSMRERSLNYIDGRMSAQFSEISTLRDECVAKLNELRNGIRA